MVEADLIEYVTEQHLTAKSKERIKLFCQKQAPQTMDVYRGHSNSKQIRESIWYSATRSYQVAKEEFAGKTCCVFKIHLINIPVIDINRFIGDKISHYKDEDEFIFLGGGVFYANETLDEPGFMDKGNGFFECWYSFHSDVPPITSSTNANASDKPDNLQYIISQIPEEEYDMIHSYHDIVGFDITDIEKQRVFDEIQKRKQWGNLPRSFCRYVLSVLL